jgi:hypothetical protein
MKRFLNGLYWLLDRPGLYPVLRYFFGMDSLLGAWHYELNQPEWTKMLEPLNDDPPCSLRDHRR